MTNMQMTAEEAKEYTQPIAVGDAPKYPYGLCLCLNDESLKKLGISDPLPVGTEVVITARAKVTSAGAREEIDGGKYANMDLQITDMEISTGAGRSNDDIAKAMYPGMT